MLLDRVEPMIEEPQAVPTFSEWFAGQLRKRGLSQIDAVWMLGPGIHPSTVASWVSGRRSNPSYKHLVAIIRAFKELPPELDPTRYSFVSEGGPETPSPEPDRSTHS